DVGDKGRVALIESTLDDAVGEAFDKVARILGLPYPGGPSIEAEAEKFTGEFIKFVNQPNYNKEGFSYSGLKTAVLNYVNRIRQKGEELDIQKIAASFQKEAIAQVVHKCSRILDRTKYHILTVSGGVSANSYLREQIEKMCEEKDVNVYFPHKSLCGDNAAMIASAAVLRLNLVLL
ncbi:MAG: tRNA (adenosine(37)-N6)-threonylcarbamoyltransferase complex transferase subunit TsaD, partial [Firmicutes bacterium]|nr:tRNA (adenosine(37)-N6)-threonylcarbamoyltransferase complex transferase subunit TsaD [Bacillota bacterium]